MVVREVLVRYSLLDRIPKWFVLGTQKVQFVLFSGLLVVVFVLVPVVVPLMVGPSAYHWFSSDLFHYRCHLECWRLS